MNNFKRIITLFVAGIMFITATLSFTACGENTAVALTVDGQDIDAGVYIYFLNYAYNELNGKINDGTEGFDVYAQTYEDKSASDWIIDKAVSLCSKYVAVKNDAKKLGVSLDSDTKSYVESMVETYWTQYKYSDTFSPMGISQDSFKAILMNNYLEGSAFEAAYGEGGEKAVSDEELLTFMNDSYARVKYYPLTKKSSSGTALDDDALVSTKSLAEGLVNMINSGTPYDDIIDEYEKQIAAANATSDTEATIETDTEADPYAKETMLYKDSTSPSEEFVSMVFEKTSSDYGVAFLYEDDDSFYIVQVLDVAERADYIESDRSSVLGNYKYEEYNDYLEGVAKDLTVERNEKAIKRYEPKKIGVPGKQAQA